MSDRFRPLSMEQLVDWVFTELEQKGSLFNVPASAFFVPRRDHRFRRREYGVELETPFGVAAGPHTQMAENIVAAWLVGARLIELKTVQTLDELEVHKPCIDVQDEGYNVEWSQELKVHESFDEYLRAWVLVHALHHRFGWPGDAPGVLFNMSVGYNLEGILRPNVQWYLDVMADASAHLPAYVEIVARRYPAVREIEIPARLSDTVTLSTMHGCPPDEIERISLYLLEERGLHTSVKCNPTLLGAERVRGIVNHDLGFADVPIPDVAFGHDLTYADAIPMFGRLRRAADARGLTFGLKLSNTLEVENWRGVFDRDPTMYLSGRALHAVTVNLASALADELGGDLPLSFAGGADCFNVADLLGSGLRTVTVCSDLLKSGGYLRLLQYPENVDAAFDAVGALDTPDFIRRTAAAGGFAGDRADVAACARFNLRAYADRVRRDWRYRKDSFRTDRSKTPRLLGAFDCIAAPCLDECPVDQQVPRYMAAVRSGDVAEAVRITRLDNPLPAILGRVCDHLCENTCIRTHLDQPLAIRQIKRFIMDQEGQPPALPATGSAARSTLLARRGHRGRSGRTGGRGVAGLGRSRGDDLRAAAVRRRHGGRGDPGLSPPAGADRAGPRRARAAGRRDPLRAARGHRRHPRRAASRGLRGRVRRRGRPASEAARPAGRGRDRDHRRRDLPAERPGGPAPRDRGARRRRGRRRHRHGLRPDGAPRGRLVGGAGLPPDRRPDAGRPRGDPRDPRGGHRDRRAGAAGRPAGRRRPAGRADLHPDRVPRDPGRGGPQGPPRRRGVRVRDRARHAHPRDQPAAGARPLRRPGAGADAGRLRRRRPGDARDLDPGRVRGRRRRRWRPRVDRQGRCGRQARRRGHRRRARDPSPGGRSRPTSRRTSRRTCRRSPSGAPGASTGCRSGSPVWIGATGSRRPCWATPPRRRCGRRVAAWTATGSAACASGSARTWR